MIEAERVTLRKVSDGYFAIVEQPSFTSVSWVPVILHRDTYDSRIFLPVIPVEDSGYTIRTSAQLNCVNVSICDEDIVGFNAISLQVPVSLFDKKKDLGFNIMECAGFKTSDSLDYSVDSAEMLHIFNDSLTRVVPQVSITSMGHVVLPDRIKSYIEAVSFPDTVKPSKTFNDLLLAQAMHQLTVDTDRMTSDDLNCWNNYIAKAVNNE